MTKSTLTAIQRYSPTYLNDLLEIVQAADPLKPFIEGRHFFVTGATGFLGRWLVDSLLLLNAQVTVFNRNRDKIAPYWLENPNLNWLEGDLLQNPRIEIQGNKLDEVIHAANDFSFTAEDSLKMSKCVFDLAETTKAKRVLFISSGAVYSSSNQVPTRFLENETFVSDLSKAHPYGAGKILIEQEGNTRAAKKAFEFKIVRGFAFLGPHQVLQSHFAAAQFFKAAIDGNPITIQGQGDAIRSYLYPTDFVKATLDILFHGRSMQPYNLGSSEPVQIRELAARVNKCRKNEIPPIEFKKSETVSLSRTDSYVPNLNLIKNELKFEQRINLDEAVQRTAKFYQEVFPNSNIRS